MTRPTRYSHLENSSQFRDYVLVLVIFYVVLTLSLTFLLDTQYFVLFWWIASYGVFTFAMSLIAIAWPTLARITLMIIAIIATLTTVMVIAKYPFNHDLYFFCSAASFPVFVGYFASRTLHKSQNFKPTKKRNNQANNHNSHAIRRRAIRRANIRTKLSTRLKVPGYRN